MYHKAKGLVSLLMVIALPFLLMLSGFTIDSGRAYLAKAQLNAAVDAAGIAAARSISMGTTAAEASAERYFNANMTGRSLDLDYKITNITFITDDWGNTSVDVEANATMPAVFTGLLGVPTWNINAQSQTLRRPVDIALVVDNSTSLDAEMATVKTRAISFLSNFNEDFDRISISKFGYGAETVVSFSSGERTHNRATNESVINAMTVRTDGNTHATNTSNGFYKAYEQFSDDDDQAANLRVIVLFTDGAPSAFTSVLNFDDELMDRASSIAASGSTAWGLTKADSVFSELQYDGDDVFYGSQIKNHGVSIPSNGKYKGFNLFEGKNYDDNIGKNLSLGEEVFVVARDLPATIAHAAREDGIYVFTLGLGSQLQSQQGVETGEELLYRMANDPNMSSSDFDEDQPQGLYCYAEYEEDLGPCFDKMLDVIIRLTM
ncbi:hypothetical protein A9264_01640 [Vibrio sp. UCD-FRSSP16_10]|uniref:vWA domain-containing protein n=1 Tax=unclassified Vibrio TaxID=2614977 RepID=UPI0007FE6FD9|nr:MULTISPECIES: VWA domain-containing protein [unclassified Vibrio]OBT13869.1 hypothetical protein A9260_03090 [Vibrio sp. UCD-FRSSP16_30]OBT22750.1 hypothetical protein A9264_01640 [Vibrio sp. UCD-FRSSP16_10]